MVEKFIIVGGEFYNKGAHAMILITVMELKKRFPYAEIYVLSNLPVNKNSKYKFNALYESMEARIYSKNTLYSKIKAYMRLSSKILLKGKWSDIKITEKVLKDSTAIIDISGYALSSQWGIKKSKLYLERIELAQRLNIPHYIMPQSIGPFDYKNQYFMSKIKKILTYPEVIYVREKQGYELLKSLGLKNIKLSPDLVLQNKDLDLTNIYTQIPAFRSIKVTSGSLAILPNMRNFDHGNQDQIMNLYKEIIEVLLSKKHYIYLIKHSGEDAKACQMIKNLFKENNRVVFLDEDFNCIEYQMLVEQFDYLIASRYHSIVHAYKEGVPCIALGWAVKYQELLDLFDQSGYVFDVRNLKDCTGILNAIEQLDKKHNLESEKIRKKLAEVQKENCFDILENLK